MIILLRVSRHLGSPRGPRSGYLQVERDGRRIFLRTTKVASSVTHAHDEIRHHDRFFFAEEQRRLVIVLRCHARVKAGN